MSGASLLGGAVIAAYALLVPAGAWVAVLLEKPKPVPVPVPDAAEVRRAHDDAVRNAGEAAQVVLAKNSALFHP